MRTLSKFLVSGLLNTIFSYLTFLIVFLASESVAAGLLSGLVVGLTTSYFLNRFWVWQVRVGKSVTRFVLFQLSLVVANWVILHIISLTSIPREMAQIVIYVSLAPFAYLVNGRYIFFASSQKN